MLERLRSTGRILWQSFKDFNHDNGPEWAASIAYYSLLSIFPLLLAVVSISSYFVSPAYTMDQTIRFLSTILPTGGPQIINIVQEAIKARSGISIISSLLLLSGGMQVFGTVMKALNIAYTTGENFTFFKRILFQLWMVLTLGVLSVLALTSQLVVNLFFAQLKNQMAGAILLQVVLEITNAILLLVVYLLTYRFIPRCPVQWRSAFWGALVSTLLFMIARPLFTGYMTYFAHLNLVYGSLAIVITLIIWAWVMALILLFGGEIASHVQAVNIERKPVEVIEARHIRRSPTIKDKEGVRLPPKAEEVQEKSPQ
ncbi:MAG: YihY/virulence factor BrkB family protein [Omnitrophica WOR_2 bacterium]